MDDGISFRLAVRLDCAGDEAALVWLGVVETATGLIGKWGAVAKAWGIEDAMTVRVQTWTSSEGRIRTSGSDSTGFRAGPGATSPGLTARETCRRD